MSVLYVMVPVALLLAGGAVFAFIRAARSGQYDDLETPAHRMLWSDDEGTGAGGARGSEGGVKCEE